MLKIKDNVDFKELNKYYYFEIKSIVYKDNKPIEEPILQWLSHWEKQDAHGMCEYIEINIGTREIRCNGCLNILYDLIKADLVEKTGSESNE